MYVDSYSEEIVKKFKKLKKKDPEQYSIVRKKIDQILLFPNHSYKLLHFSMKGIKRVHIGHFVLIFRIDHDKKIISFEDYDHHDRIYV
tara:strand:- start:289 stop:552 length:264 start_codon:yes stop_codon:yes gene_type:complete